MRCCTGSSQVGLACSLQHAWQWHLIAFCTLACFAEAHNAKTLCCLEHADTVSHTCAGVEAAELDHKEAARLNQELSKLQPVVSALQELQATKQEVGSPALNPG